MSFSCFESGFEPLGNMKKRDLTLRPASIMFAALRKLKEVLEGTENSLGRRGLTPPKLAIMFAALRQPKRVP